MSPRIYLVLVSLFALALSGCGSSRIKERKEQRETVARQAGLYCEFINGEIFPDIDVAVNLEMAKHCDSSKPYSISQYRTPSENQGIMYCCSMLSAAKTAAMEKVEKAAEAKEEAKAAPAKPEAPKAEAPKADAKPAAPAKPADKKANSLPDEEE